MSYPSDTIPKRIELSGFLIEKTAKKMKHAFAKILQEDFDQVITVDQWIVLHEIYKHKELSQYEIARYCIKDAPTITRIIDILEGKDLVKKMLDGQDRRKYLITLTNQSKQLITRILPVLHKFRLECYLGIADEDLSNLEKILNKINQNLI